MAARPVEQPRNRQQLDRLCFDDNKIIMLDFTNKYIEYQFEELRLKDYRARLYDQQLINFEATTFQQRNPLSRQHATSKVVNSPTINTKLALQQLESFLKDTPQFQPRLIMSRLAKSTTNSAPDDATANFEALKMSLVDVERRNEERGLGNDDEI